ncbi:GNAT family N-acetyltransferase [Brevibacillus daliensis]|uniref:GNAT family N-acetyltransferase n=1 Tax=Brevibacillus daliensis TaxID=2892995 RepID=UPI001E5ABF45|nr:GNAT family N-acetyltransferase [Brevibacillus daliensis]
MQINWHDIKDLESPLLQGALTLYEHTFPEELREPNEIMLRGVTDKATAAPNAFHLVVGTDEQGKVVAASTAHYFAKSKMGFIVYMMVDPTYQSSGIGGKLLGELERLFLEDASKHGEGLTGFVLETERLEDAHDEEEKVLTEKRMRFFKRHGLVFVENFPYKQPPLWATSPEVPLHLMVKWTGEHKEYVQNDWLEVTQTIYLEKYRNINRIDSAILSSMELELAESVTD